MVDRKVSEKIDPANDRSKWLVRTFALCALTIFISCVLVGCNYALAHIQKRVSHSADLDQNDYHWELTGFPSSYSYQTIFDAIKETNPDRSFSMTDIDLAKTIGSQLESTGLYRSVTVQIERKTIRVTVDQRIPVLCIPLKARSENGKPLACYIDRDATLLPTNSETMELYDRCWVLDGLEIDSIPQIGESFDFDPIEQAARFSHALKVYTELDLVIVMKMEQNSNNQWTCKLILSNQSSIDWSDDFLNEDISLIESKINQLRKRYMENGSPTEIQRSINYNLLDD